MRCLGCGEQMGVTAIAPDSALAGFEHRTFVCTPCGATEHRLLLSSGQPPAPQAEPDPSATIPQADEMATEDRAAISVGSPPPCEEGSAVGVVVGTPEEPAHESSVSVPAAAPAWARAVEKLRTRQADLSLRAQAAKKDSWNERFDAVWQRLAPGPLPSAQTNGTTWKLSPRRPWSPQASVRVVIPRRRPVVAPPVVERSPEQIQKFNEFWDSLVPNQLPARPSNGCSLAPLPRSLSLVPIEAAQTANPAARAILLLRGLPPGQMAA